MNVGRSEGISSNAAADHGKLAFRGVWRGGRKMRRVLGWEERENEQSQVCSRGENDGA